MANFSKKHYDIIAGRMNEKILYLERLEAAAARRVDAQEVLHLRSKIEGVLDAAWDFAEMFSGDNDRFIVRRFMQRVVIGTSVEDHPLAA